MRIHPPASQQKLSTLMDFSASVGIDMETEAMSKNSMGSQVREKLIDVTKHDKNASKLVTNILIKTVRSSTVLLFVEYFITAKAV